jgi:hypothetical protein
MFMSAGGRRSPLVPELLFGNALRETPVSHPVQEPHARNGVSRTAFPNRVRERGQWRKNIRNMSADERRWAAEPAEGGCFGAQAGSFASALGRGPATAHRAAAVFGAAFDNRRSAG